MTRTGKRLLTAALPALAAVQGAALAWWYLLSPMVASTGQQARWPVGGALVFGIVVSLACHHWYQALERVALRSVEERLRQVIRQLPVGIVLQNAEREILFANPTATAMLGVPEAELHGRTTSDDYWRVIREDGSDFPAAERPVAQALLSGQAVRDVTMGVCRPALGDHVWLIVNADPELDAQRRVTGVLCSFVDITERRRVEARLRASEGRLAGIIESAMDAIVMVDEHQCIVGLNPAARAIFRCSDAQALGQSINRLIPMRFAGGHSAHIKAFIDSGQTSRRMGLRASVAARRWDGEEFPAEASIAHTQVDGKPLLVAILSDVSQRQHAEVQLKQSHELLHKLSEQVPGALFQLTLDAADRFALPFISVGLRDMFGLTQQQVAHDASALFAVVAPQDRQAVVDSLRSTANSLDDWATLFRVQWPDGTLRWRQAQARPERMADGGTFWHGFVSDATERVEAKARLEQSNETLESQVAQRTQDLMLALQQAQLAMRSRGDFLAKMSHEIRTPMNTILGMAYLALKDTPKESRSHGYLHRIDSSGRHLLHIIEDILDFSKIDAGKMVLDQEDFDLDQMLTGITELIEARATEKGLRVQLRVDADVPRQLQGDPLRLSQILINFLNNAVKFAEGGVIELRVQRLPEPPEPGQAPGCRLRFEVEDHGMGIDPAHQARLFQSFEQGDNSITRQYGGSGLGLAISKQLAQLMQGSVGVRSTPGLGSTFWFTVWLQLASPADAVREAVPPPDPGAEMPVDTATLFGARILVVDDNGFNREVARIMLEGVGVQVTLAEEGAEALALLKRESFDAVLMDVQMPVMDGLEATRRLRREPTLAGLRVIALTANALREDQRRCREAGMDDVLTKPVVPDRLFATLVRWLRGDGAERPAVATEPTTNALDLAAPADTEPATTPAPVWDRTALASAVGDNRQTHQRLLNKFLISARTQVAAVQQALAQQQPGPAADAAHKLKSAARSVGAVPLGDSCETLERAGRRGDVRACEAQLGVLLREFAQCEAAISTWLQNSPEPG